MDFSAHFLLLGGRPARHGALGDDFSGGADDFVPLWTQLRRRRSVARTGMRKCRARGQDVSGMPLHRDGRVFVRAIAGDGVIAIERPVLKQILFARTSHDDQSERLVGLVHAMDRLGDFAVAKRLPLAFGNGRDRRLDRRVLNVAACEAAGIEPLIAMGRQPHHPPLAERFADTPPAPENRTPVETMAHRLKTPEGRKLYALRKQTPEPVFGIIKSVLGFRQFLLRGLDKVRGEWSLVTMAWNIKRMFTLSPD